MNNNQETTNTLQNATTTVLAATSKTPFWTAFKITMGIGLAQLTLFFGAMFVFLGLISIMYMVLQ